MSKTIIQFLFVALIVAIVGGFAGWYFFIQNKTETTETADASRGTGDPSFFGEVGSTYQNIVSETQTATGEREAGKRSPRLWQITTSPVAGFGFVHDTGALFIAERATGNILKADPDTSSIVRLTNTLVPKVREAVFSRSGDVILLTTDDDNSVISFAGTIATSTEVSSTSTSSVLEGVYLPRDIVAIDSQNHAPTARGIFFIARNPDGGSVGTVSDWKGTNVKKLFTSPLSQWRAQWLADGRTIIAQRATDNTLGYAYAVSATGAMRPLAQGVGLVVAHHETTDAYLYSTSQNGVLELFLKVGGKAPEKLDIKTTADKCVWAPGAGLIAYCGVPAPIGESRFMDRWYQGAVHTQDTIWKIEAESATATQFFSGDQRVSFDIEQPSVDQTGSYLAFRSAKDKSLWLLRITE